MSLKIVYEDEEILVVHKPAGLATQSAGIGQADVVSELKRHLSKTKKAPYLGVIHRLDQPVEGLLAFAKTPRAASSLTKQLQAGVLNKTYLAVTFGKPLEEEADLKDYLWKDGTVARVAAERDRERLRAKEARLHYRVIRSDGETSLLEVRIETGRFHQIRAQLAHAGFPILGDQKYGNEASLTAGRARSIRNVALFARDLELRHPVTKKSMRWEIEPEQIIFQN